MGSVEACRDCFGVSNNTWCLNEGAEGLTGSCANAGCDGSLFGFSDAQECDQLELSFVIPLVVGPLLGIVSVSLVYISVDNTKDAGSQAFQMIGMVCFGFACGLSPIAFAPSARPALDLNRIHFAQLISCCITATFAMVGSFRGLFVWRKAAALLLFSLTVAIDVCAIMFRAGLKSDEVLDRLVAQRRLVTFSITLAFGTLSPLALGLLRYLVFKFYKLITEETSDKGESTASSPQEPSNQTVNSVAKSRQGHHEKNATVGAFAGSEGDAGRVASLQKTLDSTGEELAALRAANLALQSQFADLLAQQRERESIQVAIPVNASTDEDKSNGKL